MIEVSDKKRVMSQKYMDKKMEDVFEYDDFNFWDTLPRQLAERDLDKKLGEDGFTKLDDIKRIHAIYDIEMKYRDEFETHGVERLEVVKNKNT